MARMHRRATSRTERSNARGGATRALRRLLLLRLVWYLSISAAAAVAVGLHGLWQPCVTGCWHAVRRKLTPPVVMAAVVVVVVVVVGWSAVLVSL